MKKIILIVFLVLMASFSTALEFRPSTVKSIDITITTEALGSFSGTISRGDELEIQYLSLQEDEDQEIVFLEEYMEIGGGIITPKHIEKNGLTYASYKINDLYKFASTNEFRVVRNARVKKEVSIRIGKDFDLRNEIREFEEFKQPTAYIESDDQELQSKASLEFQSESEIETIREIAEWVNNNIEYDFENYYNGVYSAKETYNSRAGVCDEFANLTAAFTRIKGIPTRYVTGLSFDGERFGLHGWLEVYLPETGWVGVDSTYGEAGYLDAAHISFAKTLDANKSIDFIAITKSRKPIQIEAELPLPKAEINSVEFFENLLDVEIEKPSIVQPREVFEVKAIIKNISNEDTVLPIKLQFHEKFQQSNNQRIVYFKKGETKTITWEARAPEQEFERGYYNYGMILLTPDGNTSDVIRVVPNKRFTKEGSNIRVKDVSPFINEGDLELKIELENLGNKEGEVIIEIYFEGNQVEEKKVIIKEFEEKTLAYFVRGIKPGKVLVRIIADEEKNIEITIPEKTEEELKIVEIVPTSNPGDPDKPNPEIDLETTILPIVGGAIIFILVIMAIVLIRSK